MLNYKHLAHLLLSSLCLASLSITPFLLPERALGHIKCPVKVFRTTQELCPHIHPADGAQSEVGCPHCNNPNPQPTPTITPQSTPPITYMKMHFGFNNCNVHWGQIYQNISEAEMANLAARVNANGFTYQPFLRYGSILIGNYPQGCTSPPEQSWPLYLR
jgi:hypothetical protein